MNRPLLSDPVHATNPLLEPHRVPRQLEVDDGSARQLQVEPLARRVRRQQDRTPPAREIRQHSPSFLARQAAVQDDQLVAMSNERLSDMSEGVTEFREDDDRLARAAQPIYQTRQCPQLRFVTSRFARRPDDHLEKATLRGRVGEAGPRPQTRFVPGRQLTTVIVERQVQLLAGVVGACEKSFQAPSDGELERARARERALVQHRECKPGGAIRVAVFRAHGPGETGKGCEHAAFGGLRSDEQAVGVPACRVRVASGSTEREEGVFARRSEAAKGFERGAVSVVRRRSEQEHVRGARTELRRRLVSIARRRDAMRLVDDDHIPTTAGDRRQDFGSLDVVDGRNRYRNGRPGIESDRQPRRQRPPFGRVHDR